MQKLNVEASFILATLLPPVRPVNDLKAPPLPLPLLLAYKINKKTPMMLRQNFPAITINGGF